MSIAAHLIRLLHRLACALPLAISVSFAAADERPLRVAVIGNSPPMSYENASGQLVGFNIELAEALCESMRLRCELKRLPIGDVVDAVAGGEVDFAAVSLLVTPERQRRVLFSKPYYRSMSIWLARPGLAPGAAGATVAAVRGSAQARHIETQGWKSLFVEHHRELPAQLASGAADAAIVPMPTSLQLMQDRQLQEAQIKPTILPDPLLGGDVAFSISPQRKDLPARLDAALDQLKSDGRFDRINSKYLPFKLQ